MLAEDRGPERRAADRAMVDAIRAMFGQRPLYGTERRGGVGLSERMTEDIPDRNLVGDAYQLSRPK